MERILVGLDPGKTSLWAAIHALNLAKRIKAKVFILMVEGDMQREERTRIEERIQSSVKADLEALIETERSEGIAVEYYVAHGPYDQELIRFIKKNKITLLVLGLPSWRKKGSSGKIMGLVEKIRRRVDCRIEVVHEKRLRSQ
nr:universal stress protein [Desulfobacterales bacterium]